MKKYGFIFAIILGILIVLFILFGTGVIKIGGSSVPSSIAFDNKEIELNLKDNYQLVVSFQDGNTTKARVIYESDNPTIASVNSTTGYLTANSYGKATIKAYLEDNPEINDTCIVYVSNGSRVKEIKASSTILNIKVDEQKKISVTISPADATSILKWVSANKEIATVDNNGVVSGIKAGKTQIRVSDNGGATATVDVIVEENENKTTELLGISLNKESLGMIVGDTSQLSITYNPSNASDKKVTWKSSNEKVATVKDGKVTAIGVGTATITATSSNGKTSECKVTVTATKIDVNNITISRENATLNIGDKLELNATVSPSNATDKTLTWKSSNEKVVTVKDGKVVAVGIGTATITVTTSNGKNASCTITVTKNDASCPTVIAYTGTYDGKYHGISVNGGNGGTIQYRTSTTGTWSNTNPTVKNAGTTTVYVQVLGDSTHNTKDCGSGKITINKKTVTVTADNKTMTYGGTAPSYSYTVTGNISGETAVSGTASYKVTNSSGSIVTVNSSLAAGTYTITPSGLTAGSNYTIKYAPGTLTVSQGAIPSATCPTIKAYSGTYDGKTHGITVSGGSGGTIQYRTSTTGTWSNTNPTVKNAGTTTVYVQVLGDSTHNTKDCGSSKITINKKEVTVTADNKTMTYGGTAPSYSYTLTGNISGETAVSGTAKYTVKNSSGTTVTVNSSLAAGTYTITPSNLTAGSNYTIKYVNGTLTVVKTELADATCPTIKAYSGTYDGKTHGITVSGGSGGTIQYRTSTTGTWSNTNPTVKNAGTTTVYVQVLGDSTHNTKDCGSSKITINKKEVTVKADNKTMTYGGTAPSYSYTLTGNISGETAVSGTASYKVTNSSGSTVTVNSSLAAGTYTITPSGLTAGSNYTIKYATGTLTISKSGVRIKVGTFNIQGFVKANPQTLGSFIKSKNVDIVGIQEGKQNDYYGDPFDKVRELASSLGYNSAIYKPGQINAVLSKYTIKSKSSTQLIPERDYYNEGRALVKTVININGVDISFYTVHIGLGLDQGIVEKHFKHVSEIVRQDSNPVIITGDFNYVSKETYNLSYDYFDTYFIKNGFVRAGYDTSTNNMWGKQSYCDSILFLSKGHIKQIGSGQTINAYGTYSDHNLIVATLEIS